MAKQLTYKQRLITVLELKKEGISGLFRRVKLLNEVFDDAAFREDIGGDDFSIANALDKHVDDCALTFLELRTVQQAFPNEADWKTTSLRDLLAKAIEKSKPQKEAGEKAQVERRRVTVAEHDAIVNKLKDAEFSAKTLTSEVSELRSENRRLMAENARLEGRIVELERQIERLQDRRESVASR